MEYTFVLIELDGKNEIGQIGFCPQVGAVVCVAGNDERYVVIGQRIDIGYSGKAPSIQYVYVKKETYYLEEIREHIRPELNQERRTK